MKAQELTTEQIQWIKNNEMIFKISLRLPQETLQMVFDIHNHITGLNKKTTSCQGFTPTTELWGDYLPIHRELKDICITCYNFSITY